MGHEFIVWYHVCSTIPKTRISRPRRSKEVFQLESAIYGLGESIKESNLRQNQRSQIFYTDALTVYQPVGLSSPLVEYVCVGRWGTELQDRLERQIQRLHLDDLVLHVSEVSDDDIGATCGLVACNMTGY